MAKLNPDERDSLRRFAQLPPIQLAPPPALPFMDYLRVLSSLPASLRPPKPVRFGGQQWKL
jgi:hypothetical protein